MAINGVPLCTILELVGQSSLEITKRYFHFCPDAKKEAISYISLKTGSKASPPRPAIPGDISLDSRVAAVRLQTITTQANYG